ncbi:thioredoxin domain [Gordonia phage Catfish]|uniref:NrdH-like glutaredoxin n=1 Tax=Gordonia phage Catfish TaxID=2301538 RepID=A0A385D1G8_9CAUD|nr:thioredoxin domain [Gordonia phage Catfish]AXQ51899.1 NrdH-like glutaredoxin [Gordonia phage Catfish]
MITVYTKPDCPMCDRTKAKLDERGIAYETTDLVDDPKALEFVRSLGYSSAPVVYVSPEWHWSSYKPDEIKRL